ncbi:hypothetical protein HFO97_27155 [Rhizobium leguminosarum]|uniref:hypothetical protein n=1 Tax=Rhizobium leguminosarum TaxID=384 RepID=UPI001C974D81|nr:hypothetical protein [Rhizobium leguminosarum]MBY5363561.1 hypothetical protein [Rhizobium leguminosarum]
MFEEIIQNYVELGHSHAPTVDIGTHAMPPEAREIFEEIIEIGQLWIVAHELAHFFRNSVMYHLDIHLMTKKVEVEQFVENVAPEQGEETQERWAEEMFADAIATDTLYVDLKESLSNDPSVADPAAYASLLLCGGIAVAVEVLYRLEIAFIGTRSKDPDFVPTHPPAVLRWKGSSGYAVALSGIDQRHLGFLLAGLSARFATAHQIRQELAPPGYSEMQAKALRALLDGSSAAGDSSQAH